MESDLNSYPGSTTNVSIRLWPNNLTSDIILPLDRGKIIFIIGLL